ncbi:cobalamin biosynthesis protein P47K [bacterium]|nr:cobalamin biosynthesis protein P47K [bacterium]MDA7654131.1 cobalamin biosynthesis protein P47K [Verrucomicrobiota bacterium]MDA7682316.1 cobalamin biosynthesis protein P47K [bacterium]MDB4705332.1 cobalamin biosynthesis protein P47K [Verrucomicrobiota bacterium]MDC0300096.1 cobalamin biosynthesis protein P47K [Verrucomicrobiota bacterium]
MTQKNSNRARYIMVGGFLGAGKTTSISRLARKLSDQGLRIGLITNDQGSGLVDTAMLRSKGFATAEIPGGCFCCRFNSLVDAADGLTQESRPDVFIAEPVGSCTDLVATVTYPLRRIYGDQFEIAPLSVIIDPIRAMRILGIKPGRKFSDKVVYIYLKQLEEADVVVINKIETISEADLNHLIARLDSEYPGKKVMTISAREGTGLESWLRHIQDSEPLNETAMDVDYELYAEGEALLGWLNATVELKSSAAFNGNEWIKNIALELQQQLKSTNAEVAHLKMTLSPDKGLGEIAVINLVRNDFIPELSQELPEDITEGQLIINLRAEANPTLLKQAVIEAIQQMKTDHPEVKGTLDHVEHFRPGKPEPTHRLTEAVDS